MKYGMGRKRKIEKDIGIYREKETEISFKLISEVSAERESLQMSGKDNGRLSTSVDTQRSRNVREDLTNVLKELIGRLLRNWPQPRESFRAVTADAFD